MLVTGFMIQSTQTIWCQIPFFLTQILQFGGALVSTGIEEAEVAGRGAAGLVKSGTKVIANDYEYAMAA